MSQAGPLGGGSQLEGIKTLDPLIQEFVYSQVKVFLVNFFSVRVLRERGLPCLRKNKIRLDNSFISDDADEQKSDKQLNKQTDRQKTRKQICDLERSYNHIKSIFFFPALEEVKRIQMKNNV